MRDNKERIKDILEAIYQIEKYSSYGKDRFYQDELVQTWMVHHLEILGEASRSLPPDFRKRFSNIPWSSIVGMRNILIHHYFDIALEIVWNVVSVDIPDLKMKITEILKELEGGG